MKMTLILCIRLCVQTAAMRALEARPAMAQYMEQAFLANATGSLPIEIHGAHLGCCPAGLQFNPTCLMQAANINMEITIQRASVAVKGRRCHYQSADTLISNT